MTAPPVLALGRALALIPDGAVVVASPGCGGPTTLLRGLAEIGTPGRVSLYSGLQLDGYPFLPALAAGALTYTTWHVMGPIRDLVASGAVGYVPARASEIPGLLDEWSVDVALVRVSPPAPDGSYSLGPSVSYPLEAVRRARVVLAEVDPALPRTCGDSMVPADAITALVPSETPTPAYRPAVTGAEGTAIAEQVAALLPNDPVLQVGIGAVPEALVSILARGGAGSVRFVGMGSDPMVDLFESGVCDRRATVPTPAVMAVELMGTDRLMSFAHQNPAIGLYPSGVGHAPGVLGTVERLVSVNGAVEIDLLGQVNSEVAGGRQLSGVGGSVDFAESAFRSDGGSRITVLSSVTSSGRSRIVPRLGTDSVVTVPRSMTDVVVTEYGVARLRGRTLAQRADALVAVAHPDHRDRLAGHVGDVLNAALASPER